MIRCYIRLERVGRLLLLLVVGWVGLMVSSSQAQVTLNVTNFGARGDAVQFSANTASNSGLVTTTNQLSSADVAHEDCAPRKRAFVEAAVVEEAGPPEKNGSFESTPLE